MGGGLAGAGRRLGPRFDTPESPCTTFRPLTGKPNQAKIVGTMAVPGSKGAVSVRFCSAREACRGILKSSRSLSGHLLPLTPAEITPRLQADGFCISEHDTAALLRELADSGDIVEIDPLAGYRWMEPAA